jgi:RNA 3'-terminal phosphate cyclase (ATP)
MALAGAGAFVSLPSTQHTLTNAEVIRRFLDVGIVIPRERGEAHRVEVRS